MGKEGCNFITDNEMNKIRRHLPPGSGEFSVGCVDVMNDPSEEGCFFRLYYPIEKTDIYKRNTQWPLWLPRKQYGLGYAHFLRRNLKIFGNLFNWIGGNVYIPALWQASIYQSDEKYPVVILSHGVGGNRTTYSTFCCELASNGFIVATLEHRDGSASMTYHLQEAGGKYSKDIVVDTSNGRHKRRTLHRTHSFKEEWKWFEHTDPLGIRWDNWEYRNKQVKHRAEECSRLLDLLEEINNGGSVRNLFGFNFSLKQFMGRMDMNRVSVMGHSFGGATTVATLHKDTRFRVGVLLDAWMHPLDEETCRTVKQPILMINYEKFQWRKNVEQMKVLQELDTGVQRTMITVLGAGHQAISDFQFIVGKTFGKIMEVRTDVSPRDLMDINKKLSLNFLRKHFDITCKSSNDDISSKLRDLIIQGSGNNFRNLVI